MADFLHTMYQSIDAIIKQQADYVNQYPIGSKDFEYDIWYEYQKRINSIYDDIQVAKTRAVRQVGYLQFMNAHYKERDRRRSDTLGDYIFLTINPPPEIPYSRLVECVARFTHTSVVDWSYACFEQRDVEGDDYKGFHSHIFFKRKAKPSAVISEINRIFLPVVLGNNQAIKYWSKNDLKECHALEYMRGNKKDPSKAPKVIHDNCMRVAYKLDDLYVVGQPTLTC